ncbi:hypothetical protein VTI28DRAFT_7728 [Corynascus sepedonium]
MDGMASLVGEGALRDQPTSCTFSHWQSTYVTLGARSCTRSCTMGSCLPNMPLEQPPLFLSSSSRTFPSSAAEPDKLQRNQDEPQRHRLTSRHFIQSRLRPVRSARQNSSRRNKSGTEPSIYAATVASETVPIPVSAALPIEPECSRVDSLSSCFSRPIYAGQRHAQTRQRRAVA